MEIRTVADLDNEKLSMLVESSVWRYSLHDCIWGMCAEEELGKEKAREISIKIWLDFNCPFEREYSNFFHLNIDHCKIPEWLLAMPREEKLKILNIFAKKWLAQDGVWFQAVEKKYGMAVAKKINDSAWEVFSPLEADEIKKILELGDDSSLDDLSRALNFRLYAFINEQGSYFENGSLIFKMYNCRVQAARKRKGMEDYPCKSAGIVEYSEFAKRINWYIKTECVFCPPDEHPEQCFCCWKFSMC